MYHILTTQQCYVGDPTAISRWEKNPERQCYRVAKKSSYDMLRHCARELRTEGWMKSGDRQTNAMCHAVKSASRCWDHVFIICSILLHVKVRRKKSHASSCRPSPERPLSLFFEHRKILVVFYSFYKTELFASSLLCYSIFYASSRGIIQCITSSGVARNLRQVVPLLPSLPPPSSPVRSRPP